MSFEKYIIREIQDGGDNTRASQEPTTLGYPAILGDVTDLPNT